MRQLRVTLTVVERQTGAMLVDTVALNRLVPSTKGILASKRRP